MVNFEEVDITNGQMVLYLIVAFILVGGLFVVLLLTPDKNMLANRDFYNCTELNRTADGGVYRCDKGVVEYNRSDFKNPKITLLENYPDNDNRNDT